MKKGFVLAEILAVVVILAVLASIAIPGFSKAKAKAEKNQAVVYLRAIRTSEKLYWAKWKTYLTLADKAAMKTQLGLEIQSSFTFAVAATATTFTATATSDAASGSKTLILNQAGTWSGTYTPLPLS